MNKALLIVLVLLMSASAAHACIWDRDTLAMERARFPEVNELIVGYFPRHSPAYYAWRKKQVLAIPLDQRKPSDYDDLGVSYDKLGEHGQAIATMLEKIERFPDEGLYETHANLGTFYIHNGELEQGTQYIGSAIEINPEAHFGREVYQKLLVEYVIEKRLYASSLSEDETGENINRAERPNFARFVFQQQDIENNHEAREAEAELAIKGILGMMRFGNYDSPILLEALGDLLMVRGMDENGPQRLAARAYLKASYAPSETGYDIYLRKEAEWALDAQLDVSLAEIEKNMKEEIADADAYFAKIEADEKAWIATGQDVDALFIEKYYDDAPEYSQSQIALAKDHLKSMGPVQRVFYGVIVVGSICIVCLIVLAFLLLRMRARRRGIAAKLKEA
jgi:hypothetical protein